MDYSVKFGVHNFIVNVVGRIVLVYFLLGLFTKMAYNIGLVQDFGMDVIELVLGTIISVGIMVCSVPASAQYAYEHCDLPEKNVVKRFSVIYYGSFALLQGLEAMLTIKRNWVYLNFAGKKIGENVAQQHILAGVEGVTSVIMLVCILGMIPYTLRKYNN